VTSPQGWNEVLKSEFSDLWRPASLLMESVSAAIMRLVIPVRNRTLPSILVNVWALLQAVNEY
jgi:hypothetical protein